MVLHKIRNLVVGFAASLAMMLGLMVPLASAQTDQIQSGLCSGANLQFTDSPNVSSCAGETDATTKINNIIHTIVNLLSVLVGIVAVVMIIIGGLRYITSGGNDTSVTGAKNTILYAIVGLVVVALAQIIVHFTLSKLSNGGQ